MRVKGKEGAWHRKAFDRGRMEERIGADIGCLVAERNGREKLKLKQAGVELTGRNFLNVRFHGEVSRCYTDPFFWRV